MCNIAFYSYYPTLVEVLQGSALRSLFIIVDIVFVCALIKFVFCLYRLPVNIIAPQGSVLGPLLLQFTL